MQKPIITRECTLVVCVPWSEGGPFQLYHYKPTQSKISVEKMELPSDEFYRCGRLFREQFEELKTGNITILAFRIESTYSVESLHRVIRIMCTRTNSTFPNVRFLLVKYYGDKRTCKHIRRNAYWQNNDLAPIKTN